MSEDDFSNVLNELNEIKENEKKEWDEDVIKRTISSLLSIEKEARYGSIRNKTTLMNDIIQKEMKNSREQNNVTQENKT